jgi:3-dehydroquinate synthetase
MTDEPKIVRHVIETDLDRRDAVFYTGGGLIATVTYKGFGVDVYCDGVTNATL